MPLGPEVLAERLISISPQQLQHRALHACCSPAIPPPPWLSQKSRCGAPGLALQGDGRCQSHGGGENLWQNGHSSLLTPQEKPTITQQLPPASPMGSGSSWRGRICLHAGAACPGLCTSIVCPLCHNYTGMNSPQAAMLSGFPRKPGRVPCFQGQLNSPQNLTHNFHLTHNFFAAGNWAGLGGLLTLLCFGAVIPRGCLGGRIAFPPRTPLDRETPLQGKETFSPGEEMSIST